jgi:hypothetical protein
VLEFRTARAIGKRNILQARRGIVQIHALELSILVPFDVRCGHSSVDQESVIGERGPKSAQELLTQMRLHKIHDVVEDDMIPLLMPVEIQEIEMERLASQPLAIRELPDELEPSRAPVYRRERRSMRSVYAAHHAEETGIGRAANHHAHTIADEWGHKRRQDRFLERQAVRDPGGPEDRPQGMVVTFARTVHTADVKTTPGLPQ